MKQLLSAIALLTLTTPAFSATDSELPNRMSTTVPDVDTVNPLNSTSLKIAVGPGFFSMGGYDKSQDLGNSMNTALGVNAALYVDAPVTPTFSILTGAGYVQKGFKLEGFTATTDSTTGLTDFSFYTATMRMSYIEVPLMAKFNFGNNSFRFHLAAGPFAALNVANEFHGHVVSGTSGATGNLDTSFDESKIPQFDFGARASTGVEFALNRELSVLTTASYDLGLKNLDGVKTRAILLDLGLGIRL